MGIKKHQTSQIMSVEKENSASERLAILKQTWEMIKDNPLGVGADYFEFSFIPYKNSVPSFPPRENSLEKSPHNEFLRFLAEDGIISTLIGIIFIYWHFSINRRKILNFLQDESGCQALALVVFLIPELLFQFPLQTPFPFLLVTILAGFFLYKFFYEEGKTIKIGINKAVIFFFTSIYPLPMKMPY